MLSFVASSHSLFDSSEVTNTVLALRTLGTFDFDGKMQIKANSWHFIWDLSAETHERFT